MPELILKLAAWLSYFCTIMTGLGGLYSIAVSFFSLRLVTGPKPEPCQSWPPVTILKPLCGLEPSLDRNLRSFIEQKYPGNINFIFGLQAATDPALAVIEALKAEFLHLDIMIVVNGKQWGSNRKISNLINMQPFIKYEIVVVADSDIEVDPNYLTRIMSHLRPKDVGAVTCLYEGVTLDAPGNNLWNRLSAMAVNVNFLPSVVLGVSLGLARPCFGSTIALRRGDLNAIGGFDAFADRLADDYSIGASVANLGLKIVIPSQVVCHLSCEETFVQLWRHELRWLKTIRTIDPFGYCGLAISFPLAFSLLGLLFSGFTPLFWFVVGFALLCRLVLWIAVKTAFRLRLADIWLMPLRDIISFAVYCAAFVKAGVDWRGSHFMVDKDGSMRSMNEPGEDSSTNNS